MTMVPEDDTVTLAEYRALQAQAHDLERLDIDDGRGVAECSCGWSFRIRPFKARDVLEAAGRAWDVHAEREGRG